MVNEQAVSIEWGTGTSAVQFRASKVSPLSYVEQLAPRPGIDPQRDFRTGIHTLSIDDLSGGLWDSALIGDWRKDKHHVWFNEGIQCHIPGVAALPFALTTQTALISSDHSEFNSANKRVHAAVYNSRFYAAIGASFIKNTSTSDPALTVPSTNDNISDVVGAIADATFNSTRYLVIGAQDGTTDGIKGTTDPTANDITWASIYPYTSGDTCWGIVPLKDLGINVLFGKFGGVNGPSYVYENDALLTAPTPFNLATSITPTATTYATNQAFAGACVNETSIGTIAWTNPSNATTLSSTDPATETFATAVLDDDEVSNYLYADTFGFALNSTDVIQGVEAMIFAKVSNISDPMKIKSARLVNESAAYFGDDQTSASPPTFPSVAGVVSTYVLGSATSTWGAALTPAIVNSANFGVAYAFLKDGAPASAHTISVAAIALTIWYKRGLELLSTTKSTVGSYTQRTAQTAYYTSLGNVTASDNSDARVTWQTGGGSNDLTTELWLTNWGFSLPRNAIISGVVFGMERAETDAAANADDSTVQLLVEHVAVGSNLQQADNLEYPTSDTIAYYGGPGNVWGATLTADSINSPGFGIRYQANLDSNAIDIDHVSITVYWYLPLSVLSMPSGGQAVGFIGNPSSGTRRIACIVPVEDDASGITKKRVLAYLDVTAVGVGTISYPDTQLPYVGLATPFLGGVACAGGPYPFFFNRVVLVGADGYSRDLGFPVTHGTTVVQVTQMFSLGDTLVVDTVTSFSGSVSNAQRWLYHDGKWHASWVLQSKSNAISQHPILWAETPYEPEQGYVYRFFPVSTTALAVAREYASADPFDDPHLTNTTQTKQDGPIYVQVVQLDCGPPEMLKTLTQLQCHSLHIDDNTSYGSLRVLVDTGRDITIASAEVDQTFDAAAETFADRNLVSSADPGVTFDTLCIRLIGDHQAGSVETPNLLPVNFVFTSQWPADEEVGFVLSNDQQPFTLQDVLTRLEALQTTKNVQRLLGAGYDRPMAWLPEKTQIRFRPRTSTTQASWTEVESAMLVFRTVPGGTS